VGVSCGPRSGLIVFRPSASEHARILQALAAADARTLPFAEQDLLNRLYAGRWLPLSPLYNATKGLWLHHRRRPAPTAGEPTAASAFELELAEIRNLHFTMAKPWQLRDPLNRGFGALNQLWWDAFLRGRPATNGAGAHGVGSLNKVCAVLAIRAKAAGAEAARARAARAAVRAAAPAAAALRGALPSDTESEASADSSEDELAARAADADGGAPAAGCDSASALSRAAVAAAAAAVVEAERWCLVVDEPAGHLCVPCLPEPEQPARDPGQDDPATEGTSGDGGISKSR
jgi:hypothetical protein